MSHLPPGAAIGRYDTTVSAGSDQELDTLMTLLSTCHVHYYAVDRETRTLWCAPDVAACIREQLSHRLRLEAAS